jgi:hypothetical protein
MFPLILSQALLISKLSSNLFRECRQKTKRIEENLILLKYICQGFSSINKTHAQHIGNGQTAESVNCKMLNLITSEFFGVINKNGQ